MTEIKHVTSTKYIQYVDALFVFWETVLNKLRKDKLCPV